MSKSILIIPTYVIQFPGEQPEVRVLGHTPEKQHDLDYSLTNPSWVLGLIYDDVEDPYKAIHENLKFTVMPQLMRKNVRVPQERLEEHACESADERAWKMRLELDDLKVPYLTTLKGGAFTMDGKEVEVYFVRPTHGLSLREAVGYQLADVIYGLDVARRENNVELIKFIQDNIDCHPDFFNYVG